MKDYGYSKCEDCLAWIRTYNPLKNEERGTCYRKAPFATDIGHALWPMTNREDGCFEGIKAETVNIHG